ncbi:flavodoxin family protein [Dehalobacterium formicoaceticum]|uniref:flavodoxin family protein n=1 Tax=Dehalobacterium formicoaceticum TaxID=51515 RepID=UPI0031F68937
MAKKITVIMGSPHKGRTLNVVNRFELEIKKLGEVDFEYIFLNIADLKECRGCGACLEKGEEHCPLKDDRDEIFNTMMHSDGVIFATPVYSLQVTAQLKKLLDRLAYIFHRPCFFHKSFLPIVTQGVYGAKDVLKYLDEVARFWGFKTCPGLGLTVAWENPLPSEEEKINHEINNAAERFFRQLNNEADPIPGLKEVAIFRSVRAFHSTNGGMAPDHRYYQEHGWLDSEYYYPVKLSWYKKLLGNWAEKQALKQAEKTNKEKEALRL